MKFFGSFTTIMFLINLAFSATQEPIELKSFGKTEMDVFLLRSQEVESVDVLIDYEMVDVDCHGLSKSYSSVLNSETGEVFVTYKYKKQYHVPCVFPNTEKAQDGLKLTLVPEKGNNSITKTLFAPVGSVIKVVENRKQTTGNKLYKFECSSDQKDQHLIHISSKPAGDDGYTLKAEYTIEKTIHETGLKVTKTHEMVGGTSLSDELSDSNGQEVPVFELLEDGQYDLQLVIRKTLVVGQTVSAKQMNLKTGLTKNLTCTLVESRD